MSIPYIPSQPEFNGVHKYAPFDLNETQRAISDEKIRRNIYDLNGKNGKYTQVLPRAITATNAYLDAHPEDAAVLNQRFGYSGEDGNKFRHALNLSTQAELAGSELLRPAPFPVNNASAAFREWDKERDYNSESHLGEDTRMGYRPEGFEEMGAFTPGMTPTSIRQTYLNNAVKLPIFFGDDYDRLRGSALADDNVSPLLKFMSNPFSMKNATNGWYYNYHTGQVDNVNFEQAKQHRQAYEPYETPEQAFNNFWNIAFSSQGKRKQNLLNNWLNNSPKLYADSHRMSFGRTMAPYYMGLHRAADGKYRYADSYYAGPFFDGYSGDLLLRGNIGTNQVAKSMFGQDVPAGVSRRIQEYRDWTPSNEPDYNWEWSYDVRQRAGQINEYDEVASKLKQQPSSSYQQRPTYPTVNIHTPLTR